MRHHQAAIIGHVGYGPRHADVIIGAGRRCPTIHLECRGRRIAWSWTQPHRRHYLTFAGPVSGQRGVVFRLWYGQVHWTPWRIHGVGLDLQVGRKSVVPKGVWRKLRIS